jgi:hypothetical protein
MPPVSRPPFLTVGHQLVHVFFEGFVIKLFDFFPVVEVFTERIGFAVVLMKDVKIEVLRPPAGYIGFLLSV